MDETASAISHKVASGTTGTESRIPYQRFSSIPSNEAFILEANNGAWGWLGPFLSLPVPENRWAKPMPVWRSIKLSKERFRNFPDTEAVWL